jgi:hypothetical protein
MAIVFRAHTDVGFVRFINQAKNLKLCTNNLVRRLFVRYQFHYSLLFVYFALISEDAESYTKPIILRKNVKILYTNVVINVVSVSQDWH